MKNQKILYEKPALFLHNCMLVIGDLHIGLESELHQRGVRLGSFTAQILKSLLNTIEETNAKELAIIGDLKHRITSVSPQEAKEIPTFIKRLAAEVDVHVVLGNHDAGLEPYLKDATVYPSSGFLYKEFCLLHGNAKPLPEHMEACEELVAAHWHPVYEFKDALGGRITEKIWVRVKAMGKPMLVIPSYNRLLGGVPLHKLRESWVDFNNAEMYLMNGLHLGKFQNAD